MKILLLCALAFALTSCGSQVTAIKAGGTADQAGTYGGYGEVDLGYKK